MSKQKITRLVTLVLHGRKAETEAMIHANPEMLRTACTAPVAYIKIGNDYKEYKNVTAFEAALYNADVCANEGRHEEMVEMMQKYFDKMKDGEDERQAQFDTVFPKGVEAVTAEQEQEAKNFKKSILQDIIGAIDTASRKDVKDQLKHKTVTEDNTTPLAQAFEDFRRDFKAMSVAELHENLFYLKEAIDAFARRDSEIERWDQANNKKLNLYWRMVIGYVGAVALAQNTKQIFYQGLNDYVLNGTSNHRRASLGSGFGLAGSAGRGVSWRGFLWGDGLTWLCLRGFQKYVRQKTGRLAAVQKSPHTAQAPQHHNTTKPQRFMRL